MDQHNNGGSAACYDAMNSGLGYDSYDNIFGLSAATISSSTHLVLTQEFGSGTVATS